MKLSGKKLDELLELLELYPKIGEGYRLKELFKEFWDFDEQKLAGDFLENW